MAEPKPVAQVEASLLSQMAQGPLTYEVNMLFGQVACISMRERSPDIPEYMALVEAALVHLRLLDDFLGQPPTGQHDDVHAQQFAPTWQPKRFIDPDERQRINAQVQHLAWRRTSGADWDFSTLCLAFAERFLEFLNVLDHTAPECSDWFTEIRDICEQTIDSFPIIPDGNLHGS